MSHYAARRSKAAIVRIRTNFCDLLPFVDDCARHRKVARAIRFTIAA